MYSPNLTTTKKKKPYIHEQDLKKSIIDGDLEAVKRIIQLHPVPIDEDYHDYDFLIIAFQYEHADIAKFFIQEKNFRIKKQYQSWSDYDQKPLHYATCIGDIDLVKMLLARGANPIDDCFSKGSVINVALNKKYHDIAELLLAASDLEKLKDECLTHTAVEKNDAKMLKVLLDKGLSIKERNYENLTPLCLAILRKNTEMLDLLLSYSNPLKLNIREYDDAALLFIASMGGSVQFLEKYVNQGLPVNILVKPYKKAFSVLKDQKGLTALHLAVKYMNINSINFLLGHGADPYIHNPDGLTAAHLVVDTNNSEVMELFFKHGVDINCPDSSGSTPLHYAFTEQKYKIVDLLLSSNAIGNSNLSNEIGLSNFHIASARGNDGMVQRFIREKVDISDSVFIGRDIKYQKYDANFDWHGFTALHFAVAFNRTNIVRLLLCYNVNVHVKDARGFLPLHVACQYNSEKFCDFIYNELDALGFRKDNLDKLNKKIEAEEESNHYFDSFYDSPKKEKVKSKISPDEDYVSEDETKEEKESEHTPDKPREEDDISYDAVGRIDWTQNRKDHLEIIKWLQMYRSDFNKVDAYGNSSLFYACNINPRRIIKALQKDIILKEKLKERLLQSITEELYIRRKLILQIIFKHNNVNVDHCYKNNSILHYIIDSVDFTKKDREDIVEMCLLKKANPNVTRANACSLLHGAVQLKSVKLVELLLKYGSHVDCVDPIMMQTPLHLTATLQPYKNTRDIIALLLNKGANPNTRNKVDMTPLHSLMTRSESIIVDHCFIRLILLDLLKSGANINCKDSLGRTPLHIAASEFNTEAVHDLLRFGADINMEDKDQETALCHIHTRLKPFRSVDFLLDAIRTIEAIIRHVLEMNIMGLFLSDKVCLSYKRLVLMYGVIEESRPFDNEDDFDREFLLSDEAYNDYANDCRREKLKSKLTKVDDTSVYDIIQNKNIHKISNLVKHISFEKLLKSESFKENFQHYDYLVHLQFNAGKRRNTLVPFAKCLLTLLSSLNLPDLCADYILQDLTTDDMELFIKNASTLFPEKQNMIARMHVLLRKNGNMYNFEIENLQSRLTGYI